MKKLNDLYKNSEDIIINDIKTNSKEILKNDLFVCIKGVTSDRHDYIIEAVKNGASAIVASKEVKVNVPLILVKDTNKELIKISKKFYDYDPNLLLIATTGTNGKTTTSKIIQDLLGIKCGYIGTNGLSYKNTTKEIKNTTPSPERLYKYFKELKDNNCKIISMEASSEAFLRNRLDDLKFDIGILTNISEDHLNVHKSLKNYINCKKKLFKNVKESGASILNVDDKYYEEFRKIAKGKILTYGKKKSTLEIKDINLFHDKTRFSIKYKNKIYTIETILKGEFNVYNICAAILALLFLNYKIEDIIKRINNIKVPYGRVEYLNFNQNYSIILDYAHTPDALEKIYKYVKSLNVNKIISLTGSAGGREKEKRKYMGKIVFDNSDITIFTMDDPRYEDVNEIIDDLVSLIDSNDYLRIINRKKAIYKALSLANKDDVVLILGKGRDNYMAVYDKYLKYNDYEVIKSYFENKKNDI